VKQARRVLVVDDDAWVRTMVADVLESDGYEIVTAHNGAEALAVLRATRPECVVLDLMLPVLDGRGFLRACRQERLSASTPVVVISVSRSLAEAVRSEFGVEHILVKPFDIAALLEAVKHLLDRRAARQPAPCA
jgi:DNA-binding response OmpR family regulator